MCCLLRVAHHLGSCQVSRIPAITRRVVYNSELMERPQVAALRCVDRWKCKNDSPDSSG